MRAVGIPRVRMWEEEPAPSRRPSPCPAARTGAAGGVGSRRLLEGTAPGPSSWWRPPAPGSVVRRLWVPGHLPHRGGAVPAGNTPRVLAAAPRVYGASAGSLIAAAVICAVSLDNFYRSLKRAARLSRRWFLGPVHPLMNLLQIVRKDLMENLPKNARELACGRLFISLTRVSDGQNVLVSDFTSNEELVQALLCSCFVPVYCGLIPPTFRGVRYVDGGFTNMQPLGDARNTITISPFSGEMDICPRNAADCFLIWFGKCSFVLSPENLHCVSSALFPPRSKTLQRFLWNGYRDALHYLLQNGVTIIGLLHYQHGGFHRPATQLNLPYKYSGYLRSLGILWRVNHLISPQRLSIVYKAQKCDGILPIFLDESNNAQEA
ncbi:omega-hydroxyceramide transacylase-like [Stegostoma tigrinum]|uniref:omega-hydroxyceramide transacylase-like n=1 Tax=Stegostoma tigrinum TaxID=3053191 RepID=UPI0028703287|nr:omega-hydroxyceramide transacylase-like [Stegostoma tigrinum]